jgi:hypothetical protein
MRDRDFAAGKEALHAGKRRWLVIVGGNLVLLIVMLGLPWVRGFVRTRALWNSFARYEACLYGGTPRDDPGLGMPVGHEAHFATRAVEEPGFAAACARQLDALVPPEGIFLMPGVKVAERDLRAAVALVHRELAPLAAGAPGTRLSVRPLRALERLRAGLANHVIATGMVDIPHDEAFRLPARPVLPVPTRLPLAAGEGAAVTVWGSDAELHALAIDRGGVSYSHLRAGQIAQSRVARPALMEAAIPRGTPSTFVWAMGRARCAERTGGCANKSVGVAVMHVPLIESPVPRWLGAHPSGRIDRSLLRRGNEVTVAAALPDGSSEVRLFQVPFDHLHRADMPPLEARTVYAGSAAGDPLVLDTEAGPRVLTASITESKVALTELASGGPRPLAERVGVGTAWVVGCVEGDTLGLAYGHDGALVMADLTGETLHAFDAVPMHLHEVVDANDEAADRVVRVCGFAGHAVAVAQDRQGALSLVQCSRGGRACRQTVLARGVRSFTALAAEGGVLVAYAGEGEFRQVRLRRVQLAHPERAREEVPAVCWSDDRGLCGTPILARLGQRVLLGAREGGDLMLLESDGKGTRFLPLEGLSRYH